MRVAARGALLACAMIAQPVEARLYTYTINGTIDQADSYDDQGLFGADPTQSVFRAVFTVEDALPSAIYTADATASSAGGGGMIQDGTRPPVTGTLTIGGRSWTVSQGDSVSAPGIEPQTSEQDLGEAAKDATVGSLDLGASFSTGTLCCGDVIQSYLGDGEFFDLTLYSFAFGDPDYRQTGTFAVSGGGSYARSRTYIDRQGTSIAAGQIALVPISLTVTAAAVPDAAGWATMTIGIGLAGAAMRHRRRPMLRTL